METRQIFAKGILEFWETYGHICSPLEINCRKRYILHQRTCFFRVRPMNICCVIFTFNSPSTLGTYLWAHNVLQTLSSQPPLFPQSIFVSCQLLNGSLLFSFCLLMLIALYPKFYLLVLQAISLFSPLWFILPLFISTCPFLDIFSPHWQELSSLLRNSWQLSYHPNKSKECNMKKKTNS